MVVPHRPDVSFERTPISVTPLRSLLRRGGALSLAIALFAVLAACSTPADSGGDGSDNAGGGTVAVADGVVELSAANLEFDASVIQAAAGEAFTIRFTNNDSAPHNVSVYTEEGGEQLATGDPINQGETLEVEVPAQEAGEYFFVCDIHPDMNGAVVVEG
jgi:plastocyanin